MLLINNQIVEQILDMKGCIEALDTGYRDLVNERANYRGRYDFFVPNDDPKLMYRWGTMEGASRSFETFAIRMKSDMLEWPDGKTVEKYCVEPGTFCGFVMVFSTRNGEPLAIINDGIIQHMRVGACAGLGVKYLSREDSKHRRHFRFRRHGAHLSLGLQRGAQDHQGKSLQPDEEKSRSLRR